MDCHFEGYVHYHFHFLIDQTKNGIFFYPWVSRSRWPGLGVIIKFINTIHLLQIHFH